MFPFLCKTILHSRNGYSAVTLYNPSMVVSLSPIRCFSSSAHNPRSFTISYLTKTCGLSPKSALLASKSVRFESSEQPDSVLSCFHKFGFSKTHISKMITKFPKVLHCDPDKTISPKVEFFRSKGVSTPEIVRIFTVNPQILKSSLENTLVRTFNMLTEVFQSKDKAIELIKHNPYVCQSQARLLPNIKTLRRNGVPLSNISRLICEDWLCIDTTPFEFKIIIEEVNEMGFNPLKLHFVKAIKVLSSMTKSKWDGKVEAYKRWGWSDKDITTAFKKYPMCMTISEDNIMDKMDFYVNELGLESSIIVNRPMLLSYSLKKRLIPRGAVIQYLFSEGLVQLDSSITKMFDWTDEYFIEELEYYDDEAPHLLELYNDKLLEATDGEERESSTSFFIHTMMLMDLFNS